jgi:hypothetical protein
MSLICSPVGVPSNQVPVPGGAGALLVSPYTVAWGSYEQAGGVEVSEFCLFFVVFPVRCVSRISGKFLL